MCRKVLITLGVLCVLSAAKAKADDFAFAYCPLGEGYVFLYDSPTGFQVVSNLKCGARLTVLDARDRDRLLVRTADGKEGYVLKSTATAVTRGAQQSTAPVNPGTQQPQTPQQQTPQPQTQPAKPQPQAQPVTVSQPQMPARQPELPKQSQPQAVAEPVQPAPQPQAQPQPEPQPQAQPELVPAAPAQPEPQPEPQAKPQSIEPEAQLQAEAEAPALPNPQPRAESQPQPIQAKLQPEPAATAFTPFSPLGYGRNIPRLEVYGGYSYLNAGTNGLTTRQSISGVEASVSVHINPWLAGEANLGAYYKTLQILNVGTFPYHDYTMMGGPRVNFHRMFVHALVGIDHLAGSANFYSVNTATSDNALAGAVGGGVQWSVTRQFAVRASGDYMMSRFEGITQNNVRVTLGLVFQMGSVNNRGE
jgi:opacity protein-like surface antigen